MARYHAMRLGLIVLFLSGNALAAHLHLSVEGEAQRFVTEDESNTGCYVADYIPVQLKMHPGNMQTTSELQVETLSQKKATQLHDWDNIQTFQFDDIKANVVCYNAVTKQAQQHVVTCAKFKWLTSEVNEKLANNNAVNLSVNLTIDGGGLNEAITCETNWSFQPAK